MPPGEGGRQLDLAQGRGGGVSRAGTDDPPLRRRRRRDGLRRGGAGGHPGAEGRDLPPGLPSPDGGGGIPAGRHHLRSERLRGGHRHRRTRQLRRGLHRGRPGDQCNAAPRAHERGHLEPLVLVPGQRRGPRGDAHRLPLPRDPGRAGHGDRERRSASRLRRDPGRAHRSDRGRPLPAPRGGDRTPDPDRGRLRGKGNGEGGGPLVAPGAGGQAAHPRPRPGNRPLDRGGRGRGENQDRPGPRRDRGAAHGWDGCRGRPLRVGKDVPPPGRQERPRNEEGRRLPAALHRGGERGRGPVDQGDRPHGDGQGRRSRHRQEHRGRRPPV